MTTAVQRREDQTALAPATVGEEFLAGQLTATARAYRADVEDFFGKACEDLTAEDLRMATPGRIVAWRNDRCSGLPSTGRGSSAASEASSVTRRRSA